MSETINTLVELEEKIADALSKRDLFIGSLVDLVDFTSRHQNVKSIGGIVSTLCKQTFDKAKKAELQVNAVDLDLWDIVD